MLLKNPILTDKWLILQVNGNLFRDQFMIKAYSLRAVVTLSWVVFWFED
ncbi:hypothetical protein [Ectobacillus funiculus]|nr:hypothetical protein [Ectobacillus funiculus]